MHRTPVTIEIDGETREVLATSAAPLGDTRALHVAGELTTTIGPSVARYAVTLALRPVTEDETLPQGVRRTRTRNGRWWAYDVAALGRERNARVAGWTGTARATNQRRTTRRP